VGKEKVSIPEPNSSPCQQVAYVSLLASTYIKLRLTLATRLSVTVRQYNLICSAKIQWIDERCTKNVEAA
jgi:hypothetical protein